MNTTSSPLSAPSSPRVAIYARVSTEGMKGPDGTRMKGQTVDPQLLELREYCARQGWSVVGEWTDVMSGTLAARPGLDSMLVSAARGDVDTVVVVKLDRLGRSLLNVVRLIETLDSKGVAVICTTQGIDTRKSSPTGRFVMQLMAAFSELERAIISERTKAGLKAVKARGTPLGKPSRALAGVTDVPGVVAAWRAETGGKGLRELARRLGGCSTATAARLARV